ncbi:MAG: type II toxin-antitoxin system VapC family toxin [Patescibacteria group bacterium]
MIVIDASVVNKLVLSHEEGHDQAIKLFKNHIAAKVEIFIPDLLFYEVANTLATKAKISNWKMTNSLTKLYQMGLNIYYPTEIDIKVAARLAKSYHTSVYDMVYVVIAKRHKTTFITADRKFAELTNFKSTKLLSDLK